MSLGDELRYLRALHGGGNLMEIEGEMGLEPGTLRYMEQRYRRVGEDDDILAKIAAYYDVPLATLQYHRERYRKALSAYLHKATQSTSTVRFELRTGETMSGQVHWWDLGAFGLQPSDGEPLIVVQRHAVLDWEGAAGVESTE
jgi:transcriptional regulator with XRE-family HTH domain